MKTRSTADQTRWTKNFLGKISTLSLTVMALVTLGTLSSASGQLIGLDFGSSFIKGTLVQPGQPFSIIENTASARKTETMMTIGPENRLYGKDSFLESAKNPKTTFADLLRIFGRKFDGEEAEQLKKDRLMTNDFVADGRGNYAYQITRKPVGAETEDQVETLYAEEIIGTMVKQFRSFAETMSNGQIINSGVISVPSWFSYDQRQQLKDAVEGLGGFNVQQLIHENVAAATMFGIDQKLEANKTLTVLFYNMGGMDSEATVVRYSLMEIGKKTTPYIEILSEASRRDVGAADVDLALVRLLAQKFDALPEREGKDGVLNNVRATKRLQKEAVKIKETLSANRQANVKIPELLDQVTLKILLDRDELNTAAMKIYERVAEPALEALKKANITASEVDQIELIGGGVRIPKVLEMLEAALERKDLSVHLNGDEAMCFGSAFIASNSSSSFKVKSILLTQHPEYDVQLKISPTNATDSISEEDQKAEGLEEADIIKYNQDLRLFDHTKDYMGKSKGLSMNYNKDMTLQFYRVTKKDDGEEQLDLIDTFYLENVAQEHENEMKHQVSDYKSHKDRLKRKAKEEADKKKKEEKEKAKKDKKDLEKGELNFGDDDKENDDKKEEKKEKKKKEKKEKKEDKKEEDKKEEEKVEEEPEEDYKATTPKLKVSIEFSRSGYLVITKAQVASKAKQDDFTYDHSYNVDVKQFRKPTQMTEVQMKEAKNRMKWYKERDENKIKTDEAKNNFESLVYAFRSWLREEENEEFVVEEQRESWIEKLNEMEDWLYEDGSDANFTAYRKKREDLNKDYEVFQKRELFHREKDKTVDQSKKVLSKILEKVAELSEKKPWITEEQKTDVKEKVEETRKWMEEELAKQDALKKHEDPVFSVALLADKMKKLQRIFKKVSQMPKPKEKKKEEEKEEFAEGEDQKEGEGEKKEGEGETEKEESKDDKKEETKDEEKPKEEEKPSEEEKPKEEEKAEL